MTCFVANLVQRVIVLSMVIFFVGLRIDSSDDKIRSDIIIKSNHVYLYVADLES